MSYFFLHFIVLFPVLFEMFAPCVLFYSCLCFQPLLGFGCLFGLIPSDEFCITTPYVLMSAFWVQPFSSLLEPVFTSLG